MSAISRCVVSIAIALVSVLIWATTASAQTPNLLQNWGFESGFYGYGSGQVGNGWKAFVIYGDPQFLDTGQFPFAEKTEGNHGQQIWSDGGAYHAGLYQTVTNAVPGQTYRFKIAMATQYGSSTSGNVMFRSAGIDPKGGIDPTSPNVMWSQRYGKNLGYDDPTVSAVAQGSSVTVFAKVEDARSGGPDKTWIDAGFLEPVGAPVPTSTPVPPPTPTLAPPPTATATPVPPPPTFTPVPPPPTKTPLPSPTPKPAEPVMPAVSSVPTASATLEVSRIAEPIIASPLSTDAQRAPDFLAAIPEPQSQMIVGRVAVASSALDYRVGGNANVSGARTGGFVVVSVGLILLMVGGTTLLVLRRRR